MATCAFCGTVGKLSGEHVLADWLTRIGLDLTPVPHSAGWLNKTSRDLGKRSPFGQKVRDVCAPCNNGWMSDLEYIAQRVLTPMILGQAGTLEVADAGAVATWLMKTAMTAMLVSSKGDRARGYGVPAPEFRRLYDARESQEPLSASQFWIGQHDGSTAWSVRVTPFTVAIQGLETAEQDMPHGYAMTVLLGQLAIQGVRFTSPLLQIELTTRYGLPQFWPTIGRVEWPDGTVVGQADFFDFVGAKDFRSRDERLGVHPWIPATESPRSELFGSTIGMPTICGKHVVYYPAALVAAAAEGSYYAFWTECECGIGYLVHTESDGAHTKAADELDAIQDRYHAIIAEELLITDENGTFGCKRL